MKFLSFAVFSMTCLRSFAMDKFNPADVTGLKLHFETSKDFPRPKGVGVVIPDTTFTISMDKKLKKVKIIEKRPNGDVLNVKALDWPFKVSSWNVWGVPARMVLPVKNFMGGPKKLVLETAKLKGGAYIRICSDAAASYFTSSDENAFAGVMKIFRLAQHWFSKPNMIYAKNDGKGNKYCEVKGCEFSTRLADMRSCRWCEELRCSDHRIVPAKWTNSAWLDIKKAWCCEAFSGIAGDEYELPSPWEYKTGADGKRLDPQVYVNTDTNEETLDWEVLPKKTSQIASRIA